MSIFIKNKYQKIYFQIIQRARKENRKKLKRNRPDYIYYELHHILPQCLWPQYKDLKAYPWNGVLLTAREHFLCHFLLVKMVKSENKGRVAFGLKKMNCINGKQQRNKIPSRLFKSAKEEMAKFISELHTGKTVSEETRKKQSKKAKGRISPFKGKKHSETTKQQISKFMKDQGLGSGANNPAYNTIMITDGKNNTRISKDAKIPKGWSKGYTASQETRDKISAKNKEREYGPVSEETKQKISKKMKGRSNFWITNQTKIECPHCNKKVVKCNFNRWHGDNCKNKNP